MLWSTSATSQKSLAEIKDKRKSAKSQLEGEAEAPPGRAVPRGFVTSLLLILIIYDPQRRPLHHRPSQRRMMALSLRRRDLLLLLASRPSSRSGWCDSQSSYLHLAA
jgi:hypothetical protein